MTLELLARSDLDADGKTIIVKDQDTGKSEEKVKDGGDVDDDDTKEDDEKELLLEIARKRNLQRKNIVKNFIK